jgi:hypothetical protein
MVTLDANKIVSIIIYKEKSESNVNYMEMVFHLSLKEASRTAKLVICGMNKVCKRGRYSHVVLVLSNSKSPNFA